MNGSILALDLGTTTGWVYNALGIVANVGLYAGGDVIDVDLTGEARGR